MRADASLFIFHVTVLDKLGPEEVADNLAFIGRVTLSDAFLFASH